MDVCLFGTSRTVEGKGSGTPTKHTRETYPKISPMFIPMMLAALNGVV